MSDWGGSLLLSLCLHKSLGSMLVVLAVMLSLMVLVMRLMMLYNLIN